MAQAFEYQVVRGGSAIGSSVDPSFAASLGTLDVDGWEVIGFAVRTLSQTDVDFWALLRRRV